MRLHVGGQRGTESLLTPPYHAPESPAETLTILNPKDLFSATGTGHSDPYRLRYIGRHYLDTTQKYTNINHY